MGTTKSSASNKVTIKKGWNWLHLVAVSAVFGVLGIVYILSTSAAGNASLSLIASDAHVQPDDEVTVQIRLNSDGDAVNALETNLDYDTSAFQFVSILDANPPWDVNLNDPQTGTINIVKGTTGTPVNDTNSLVATVTFRALDTSATANFSLSGSIVVRAMDSEDVFGLSSGTTVVVDNVDPTVNVATPADGALAASVLPLTFNASDATGLERLEVIIDGSVQETITDSGPFYSTSIDTTTLVDGVHTLQARAFDIAGNSSESSVVSFTTDNTAPTVILTQPTNGNVTDMVQFSADATDARGVSSVTFLVNGLVVNIDTTSPYTASWDSSSVADGTHTVTARAADEAGNVTSSNAAVVNVDNTAPTVSITSPSQSDSVSGTVNVTADANDASGIASVEFLVDGSVVSTDTTAPYSFSWDTAGLSGNATLAVRAVDNFGNGSATNSIQVTIDNLRGDVSGDGVVNIFDLSQLLNRWGDTTNLGRNDINGDGAVNIIDLSMLLAQWGQSL